MTGTDHSLLDPGGHPETILYRDDEQAILQDVVVGLGQQHLYVHGPRGAGKTLLIRDALISCTIADTYYLSCIPHDTQYKVLDRLYTLVSGDDLNPGYHTAQLQQRLAHQLRDANTLIVLDDLEFLLANDGNDLLYFLSRLDHHTDLRIIGIGTAHASLATVLDERTYSSLRPRPYVISPYTEDEAVHILTHRIEAALPPDTVEPAALAYIAATTANLTLGLHWLSCAADQATSITPSVVEALQTDAVHRYREAVLDAFTPHHTPLLEAIEEVIDDTDTVTTGTVYEQYTERCYDTGLDPLTARRISDYLTHLELLNLIDVTHYRGGKRGKTREIQLTPLQEL